ncbi:MAG TPA: flippase [Methylomirabilota bacterium]|nr:flippase [Methylomirabilota bacterium]
MKALPRVARNLSFAAVAQAITWTATFLFTLAQARYLGPVRFGELSLALSYAALLGVVVDFGLSTKLARDVAQRPASAGQALVATLVLRVGLWCIAMPFVWASTIALGYHAELQASILILGASLLVGGFASSLGAYFQGREEFLFPSLGSVAQRGSAAVLGVAALALGQGVVAVALAYVLASVLQVVVLIPGMRSHPVSSTTLERTTVVNMFRGAAVLGCFWILGTFYYNVDMLILQRLVPAENVAWYAAAYRLFNASLGMVALLLGMVLYPVLSRLSIESREALRLAMERSFTFLVASGVFIAVTLIVAADEVVALLYPAHEYGEAAHALRLLAPGLVAMYANGAFFLALLAMGFERRLLVMAAVLAVLNPLANLLVIPLLQQNGAALVTSVTEVIVLVWVLAATPKDLRSAARPSVVVKILVAATLAAACLWLLRERSLLIGVPVAAILYSIAVLALGVVPASSLRAVRILVSRVRPGAGPLAGSAGRDPRDSPDVAISSADQMATGQ